MSKNETLYHSALALIDAANREDPNKVSADGKEWPKELLYSQRMSDMLSRYAPDADDAQKLAIRAQHIERWKSPRNAYPMDRIGYLKWRKDLYKIQADTAAGLLGQAGYGDEVIDRVRNAVAKKNIKGNPDTQLLEDVTDLVFMEHYMLEFVAKHPDYTEEKWIEIIQKTWNKMSDNAHQFALSGAVRLPESLLPLIEKAVTATNAAAQ
ncbi:MAG: DUF4202 domain-containing protein [Gammaproteobacteria bacterium]|nr:DUF4202 domain-containing protein [Gammaproteobacteria bacterium]MDH3447959.1 DUF4202 domain-containing protein [Gammaproteobacteria bacterium]